MIKKKIPKKKRMFSWMNPKLEVRNTKKYGKGVFAIGNLKKDEILAIFGGYVMTLEEEEKLPKKIHDYALQIQDNFVIGITKTSEIHNKDNFFNHSCEPNAGFKGQIFLVSMRNILEKEEITFDYAMVLGGDDSYSMGCFCGLEKCRKIITNSDWKNKKLQKKYQGYFQWYIENKINNK